MVLSVAILLSAFMGFINAWYFRWLETRLGTLGIPSVILVMLVGVAIMGVGNRLMRVDNSAPKSETPTNPQD